MTTLYAAVARGELERVREMLASGVEPNDGDSLYHAAEHQDPAYLRALLEAGARPAKTNALKRKLDFEDRSGESGHRDGLQLLLDAGADPNEDINDSGTSLHHAVRRGRNIVSINMLIKADADVAATWQGHTAYALAVMLDRDPQIVGTLAAGVRTTLSPIEAAVIVCARGKLAHVRPDAEASDYVRMIHTDLAKEGRTEFIERLLDSAPWIFGIDTPGDSKMTALHHAVWFGHLDTVRMLVERGASLEYVNMYGSNAYELAFYSREYSKDAVAAGNYEHFEAIIELLRPLKRK